jgi:hypothetical protein
MSKFEELKKLSEIKKKELIKLKIEKENSHKEFVKLQLDENTKLLEKEYPEYLKKITDNVSNGGHCWYEWFRIYDESWDWENGRIQEMMKFKKDFVDKLANKLKEDGFLEENIHIDFKCDPANSGDETEHSSYYEFYLELP